LVIIHNVRDIIGGSCLLEYNDVFRNEPAVIHHEEDELAYTKLTNNDMYDAQDIISDGE